MPATHGSIFDAMLQEFDGAARILNLEPGIWKILTNPKRQITVSCPIQMDNGEIEVFTGYRVQYNITLGPAKGGIRYHPGVTLAEVTARESAKHVGFNIKGARVAIQGFGNVGSVSADLLVKEVGATIVGVADWKGGVFNAKGLDTPKLLEYVVQHKTVAGFPGADPLTNEDLFKLDLEI